MTRSESFALTGAGIIPWWFQRTPDWNTLECGDRVLIRSGNVTVTGQIDTFTLDGTVMWLFPDGGQERRMYHRADDDEFWRA
jgi:hypothetical protein